MRIIKRIAIALVICLLLTLILWGAVVLLALRHDISSLPQVTPTIHPLLGAMLTAAPRLTSSALGTERSTSDFIRI